MKNILGFVFISVVLNCSFLFADPEELPTPPDPFNTIQEIPEGVPPEPTASKIENMLYHYQGICEVFDEKSHYQEFVFEDQLTKKSHKFSDLSEKDQLLFIMFEGERLTFYLNNLQTQLEFESKRLTTIIDSINFPKDKKPPDELLSLKESVSEIDFYTKQIFILRQKVAVKFERYIKDTFVKLKEDISEKEQEAYLGIIKDYHDKNSLIERQ